MIATDAREHIAQAAANELQVMSSGAIFGDGDHAQTLLNELLNEMSVDMCFEVHREAKTGQLQVQDLYDSTAVQAIARQAPSPVPLAARKAPNAPSLICYNCERSVSASRFAPHLDKCMATAASRTTRRK